MYYDEFKNMHEIHPVGRSADDRYSISLVSVCKPDMFEMVSNPEMSGQLEQTICVLNDNKLGEIVMSDSWMEQETNIKAVQDAHGDVLVGGLGMGMILLGMQDLPQVKSITVVEISQELIDFIKPNLPLNSKVDIICWDLNDFSTKDKFDYIYCDIWNDTSSSNLENMEELTDRFDDMLNDGGETKHWRHRKTEELWKEENGIEENAEFY